MDELAAQPRSPRLSADPPAMIRRVTDLADFIARPAQGRAARPPRRLGLAAHRLRARRAAPGHRAERPGRAADVLRVPRLRALRRGLPRGRRPDPDARGHPLPDLRGRPRDGDRAGAAVRRAHLHAVHLGPPARARQGHADRGLHRGDRGRAGRGRARLRAGAALDLRHPGGVRAAGGRRDARLRARTTGPTRWSASVSAARRSACRGPQFQPHFDAARAAGLHSVPHAGETTGPETVWDALRLLGAERIGHGTSSAQDPELLAHLAETGIPLEVCPSSNIATRAVATLDEHPIRGVPRRRRDDHRQLRRPADVRHHAQPGVRDRRRPARPRRGRRRRPGADRRPRVLRRPTTSRRGCSARSTPTPPD